MPIYTRNTHRDIRDALKDTPVILIRGPRRSGKSTLTEACVTKHFPAKLVTLDDPTTLASAISSPTSFIESLPDHVIIDEIQRAPELFLPIKKRVDQRKKPGQFLLTGSADIFAIPTLPDSLAGRMETHTLWPLSQGELANKKEHFIDACFDHPKMLNTDNPITWASLVERLHLGGYPEMLTRANFKRRKAWTDAYLTAIVERDIRSLSNINNTREFAQLLNLLITRIGGTFNAADLSRTSTINQITLKRHVQLLENVFALTLLPAWAKNAEKRLIKAPKIFLNDTGLATHALSMNQKHLEENRQATGKILENFVLAELIKQQSWSETTPKLYHFRTHTGEEVDIVMEAPDGRIVGIEIKSKSDLNNSDFKGLRSLQDASGKNFVRGLVLYTGENALSFDKKLSAAPISALWST